VLHQNFIDETPFLSNGGDKKVEVNCPTLFVRAMDDFAITSSMVDTMLPYIPHLTIKEVRSSHWIMIQRPQKVNEIVQTWLQEQGINQN
jgi:pimeloyl-ACP methyl ester carboxylesterase